MKVLVLGGTGFIGRHAVLALLARGHEAVVGTRYPARAARKLPPAARACERRGARLERLTAPGSWDLLLEDIDAVVNCVGILRERGEESYERVHHLAPAALARDCARLGLERLIHVSALGLHAGARSAFLTSKLRGEQAIKAGGTDWTIVRPSLLDGEGGFGARWMRMVACWPVHFVPAEAKGRIAALDVGELGEAIAVLCEARERTDLREVELGGTALRTMREYLAALRRTFGYPPALCVELPAWLARLASHLCDLLHFSPFSFGHLELMRRDNTPRTNLLPFLLKRTPKAIGLEESHYAPRAPVSAAASH
jgi:NADH dehydrogenase